MDKKFGQLSIDSICRLFPSEIITIKDYITSLQEKEIDKNFIKECGFNNVQQMALELSCLQEENERLKEELNYTVPQVQHNQIVTKLCKEKEDYKSRCENAQDLILNELSHLEVNDEETWNKEFYDENNKLDYRKLCIEILNQAINLLDGGDE